MNKQNFELHYYQRSKGVLQFRDNYREGIEILPTQSNETNSSFKTECGFTGVTGEFIRLLLNSSFAPIQQEQYIYIKIKEYFETNEEFIEIDAQHKKILLDIANEVLFNGNKMTILDPTFYGFMPLTANNVNVEKRPKYDDSQIRLAHYLYNMLDHDFFISIDSTPNLLTRILKQAIEYGLESKNSSFDTKYTILTAVKKLFQKDLRWFLTSHSDSIIVQYLPLLLYFYCCFGIVQMTYALNPKEVKEKNLSVNTIHPIYFQLDGEAASSTKPSVQKGWHIVAKSILPKMLGHLQSLDILNTIAEDFPSPSNAVGFYPEVLSALKMQSPWNDSTKQDCEEILNKYQTDKKEVLKGRDSKGNKDLGNLDDKTFDVNSYEDFAIELDKLCCQLNTIDYTTRFANKISDILKLKLLKIRRGYHVLALDDEMLLFVIALVTHEQKTRLKDLYSLLKGYGIVFNQDSVRNIENYLLKLNLLDRKSDSGEAQYVTIIL